MMTLEQRIHVRRTHCSPPSLGPLTRPFSSSPPRSYACGYSDTAPARRCSCSMACRSARRPGHRYLMKRLVTDCSPSTFPVMVYPPPSATVVLTSVNTHES
jgi:hypothetical protein